MLLIWAIASSVLDDSVTESVSASQADVDDPSVWDDDNGIDDLDRHHLAYFANSLQLKIVSLSSNLSKAQGRV